MSTQTTPGSGAPTSAGSTGTAAQETKQAAADVASTAKDEAATVAREARRQTRALWQQARSDLTGQATDQQGRAAQSLRDLSDQLRGMATDADDGMARTLVDDVARRAGDVAGWLEERDPGAVLDEARRFARQRPGAFLLGAAALGVLAGRMSRGLVDEQRDGSGDDTGTVGSVRTTGGSVPTTVGVTPSTSGTTVSTPETSGAGGGAVASGSALVPDDLSEGARASQPLQPDGSPSPIDEEGRLTADPDDPFGGGRR